MVKRSETGSLSLILGRAGAALERFLGEPGDPLPRRATWSEALEGPLPAKGVNAGAVVGASTREPTVSAGSAWRSTPR
jgi:hypothetical protein